jgi:hypothetical protein
MVTATARICFHRRKCSKLFVASHGDSCKPSSEKNQGCNPGAQVIDILKEVHAFLRLAVDLFRLRALIALYPFRLQLGIIIRPPQILPTKPGSFELNMTH